ncbi:MAG: hypothetical protein LCH89_02885 [Proteobacteria bacterium]|nr:hypothetical protein [Pseudomonadota bacterium]
MTTSARTASTRLSRLALLTRACSLTLALGLAACGGGGDNTDTPVNPPPPPPPPPPVAQVTAPALQGAWRDASSSALLIAGASPSQASVWWLEAQRLTKLALSVATDGTLQAQGRAFPLTGGPAQNVTYGGSASLNPASLSLNSQPLTPASLPTSIDVGALAGAWHSLSGNGAIRVNWSLATSGALAGSASTGCTYAGQLGAHPGLGVLDATLSETCPGSPSQMLSGVGSVQGSGAAARLNLLLTTTGDAAALVLALQPGA